jgi:hypothetical protein
MNLRVLILVIVACAGVAALGYWLAYSGMPGGENGETACTLEAKLCPDGSYVGRTGPNCEFAQCPDSTSTPRQVTLEARIDQGASGLDVKVVPLEVLEDSRCPIDVTCIQAGTVRLRAQLESGLGTANPVFTLGTPVTTEAETVELIEVRPPARQDVALKPGDYTFVFRVTKRVQ